jgi:hypothetical protein
MAVAQTPQPPQQPQQPKPGPGVRFVTQFRHWRSGKLIKAEDYGKKAFVFYN